MKGLSLVETVETITSGLVEITSVTTDQDVDSMIVSEDKQRVTIWRTASEEDEFVLTLGVTSTTASEDTTVTVTYDTRVTSECACVTPGRRDSLVIRSRTTTTSAVTERDVHESTDPRIRYANETLEMQCSHGQLWRVTVVDIVGRVVKATKMSATETTWLSLGDLPAGAYIVYATDGKDALVQTIVK